MSKTLITAIIFTLLFISGCQENMDDSRFKISPEEADFLQKEGVIIPDAEEVDLVEDMAAKRNAYRAGLKNLLEYYKGKGSETQQRWAQHELDSMVQYRYLMPGQIAPAGKLATDSIEEADKLYEEAMELYNDAGALMVIVDENKYRMALNKFNLLMDKYPSSDKADDSAYRAARIYQHFKDYEIAVVYYQRTFQWNEVTPYPARFRAAEILDRNLHMRKEAVALYQLAMEKESKYERNYEIARRRLKQLMKPIKELEEEVAEETPLQGQPQENTD